MRIRNTPRNAQGGMLRRSEPALSGRLTRNGAMNCHLPATSLSRVGRPGQPTLSGRPGEFRACARPKALSASLGLIAAVSSARPRQATIGAHARPETAGHQEQRQPNENSRISQDSLCGEHGDYLLPTLFPAPILRPVKCLEPMLCLGLSTDRVRMVYREYMTQSSFLTRSLPLACAFRSNPLLFPLISLAQFQGAVKAEEGILRPPLVHFLEDEDLRLMNDAGAFLIEFSAGLQASRANVASGWSYPA